MRRIIDLLDIYTVMQYPERILFQVYYYLSNAS